jgi:hypothetical protein
MSTFSDFWQENGPAIQSLVVYALGILVYVLVVYMFYQVMSRRLMFAHRQDDGTPKLGGRWAGLLYLLLFPLVSFAYFLLLTLSLLFLGGEEQNELLTITLAAAIVLAVRVAAYFNQPTSHDLAKTLPLGLLAVILVRADLFQNLVDSTNRLAVLQDHAALVAAFFAMIVLVEFVLRALWHLFRGIRRHRQPEAQVSLESAPSGDQ